MRESQGLRQIAGFVVLFTAAIARAQCLTVIQPVSQTAVFPSHSAGPIATNGSIIGVAKTDTSSGTPAIYVSTYDSSLNPITVDRQIAATSLNGPVALLWNSSEFALFYQALSLQLIFQRIDTSGTPIGAPIAVTSHGWSSNDEFDVVWNPQRTAYAVARTVTQGPDHGLWVTMITPAGAVVSDVALTPFIAPPTRPRVIALPNGSVALVWLRTGDAGLDIATIGPTNLVTFGIASERPVNIPTLATDGNSILTVYQSPTGANTELRYSQLDLNLNLLKSDLPFLMGTGVDIVPMQLFWNSVIGEWALTYIDALIGFTVFPGDMRLRRFASPTGMASDTLLSPDPLHSRLVAAFPIVFLNNGYVASIQRVISRTEGSESYLVRTCPFVAAATADHPIWPQFLPVTFTAVGSGGTPGYTFQWQFGDNDSASGAVARHVYQNPGTYMVTLTATDTAGAKSISKITVQITTAGRQRTVRH